MKRSESILLALLPGGLFATFCVIFLLQACSPELEIKTGIDSLGEICTSCAEPNLFRSEDGQIMLTWLFHENDTSFQLNYAMLNDNSWTDIKTIATGRDWFVNWADFPSMAIYSDSSGTMAAHWLEMSAEGTYDYDIKISQSMNKGASWAPAFTPHRDGIQAEHGFVSLLPLTGGRMFATWLDGRNTKTDGDANSDGHAHGHGGGAMTLRSATFDQQGNLYDEAEMDARVCDCCQTSATKTNNSILVAYRDRSEKEIRDISIVRKEGETWSEPKTIYSDNWFIPGCPVNGPVIKSSGSQVAVAWFAMNDTLPEVKVAFSSDDGRNFALPTKVDLGDPLGRVGLEFISDSEVVVSWIENGSANATIYGRKLDTYGVLGPPLIITQTSASRRSGFPVITRHSDGIVAAWTHVDSVLSVRTAFVEF